MPETALKTPGAPTPPRVAIRTVGCRLNQAESARMAGAFIAAGYQVVDAASPCDVFIVHSCTITANAESDSYRLARAAARRSPRPVVVVAGCAVEVAPDSANRRSLADLVVGQEDKQNLPALIAERFGFPSSAPDPSHAPLPFFSTTRAIVRVQDGCRFGCSYCIVPSTRSQLWSRPPDDAVAEVQRLFSAGYREIVVTGANLGCYRSGRHGLPELLTALLVDTDMPRIRLSSIESSTITDDLLGLMAGNSRICRALHIPLQSGSDAVLQRMKRRYTREAFRSLLQRTLEAMPLLGIGTDIITGFPGETEADHQQTRELIESLPFSNLHVFPFSPRPGTAAATLAPRVTPGVARERARALIDLGADKRNRFAERFIGREVSVLVEKTDNQVGSGWTSEYLPARVGTPSGEHAIVPFLPVAWRDGVLC